MIAGPDAVKRLVVMDLVSGRRKPKTINIYRYFREGRVIRDGVWKRLTQGGKNP